MAGPVVAIVDPYDAGAMLAPVFAERGAITVMVGSVAAVPRAEAVSFDPATFHILLPWQEKEADMVVALRRHRVDRVIAGSERGVMLADRLAAALGLPGNGTLLSAARRDKARMIETVGRHGIRVPLQIVSDRLDAIMAWIVAGDHWPVVVKPRGSKGSDGVRLCATREEVARAFHAVHGHVDRLGLRNETVLVQEYLIGREYVVDTVSQDGRHRLAALWAYGKPAPGYDAIGLLSTKTLLPPRGALAETLFAFAVRVLAALEIRHGAGHCELIIDADGPVLVEIGARLHGGPPAHLMSRAVTGTSQLDLLVQSCVDPAAFLAGIDDRDDFSGGAVMVLLRDVGLRDEIETLPSAHSVVWNAAEGVPSPPVAGLATLIHADHNVVAQDFEIVTGGLACALLEQRDAVEAIAPAWQALLERSRCHPAFGGPDWYRAALDTQTMLAPKLIAVFRAGRLAGLLPLVSDGRIARFATMLSDYNDLIVADGDEAAARRLMTFARRHLPPLELDCVRADADCARTTAAATLAEKRFVCPFADLSDGYETWLAARSPLFRTRLRQAVRHAARHDIRAGPVDPVLWDMVDPAACFLEMQAARFGSRSLFLRDPAARAFVESALPKLIAAGNAAIFGLWEAERMIGINICLRSRDGLGYWNAGFLPDYASFSPGTLMIHAALRAACALGFAEFDFLRGAEPYKLKWCGGRREIGRLA